MLGRCMPCAVASSHWWNCNITSFIIPRYLSIVTIDNEHRAHQDENPVRRSVLATLLGTPSGSPLERSHRNDITGGRPACQYAGWRNWTRHCKHPYSDTPTHAQRKTQGHRPSTSTVIIPVVSAGLSKR